MSIDAQTPGTGAVAQGGHPGITAGGEVAAARMTQMQTHIFISQGVAAYRLPFVFELAADETLASVERRVRAAVRACPGLACTYGLDPQSGVFVQRHAPGLVDELAVTDRGTWSGTVDEACAQTLHAPSLRSGLPVSASVVTVEGTRHLIVEFHHIAVDGPGAALFEALLLAPSAPPAPDAATVLAAYDRVAAEERTRRHTRPVTALRPLETDLPAPPAATAATARLGRCTRTVPTAAVRRLAREQRAFPRVVLQAAFESWLAERHPGCGYAWVSSWRWTLDLAEVVGNFPVLLARPAPAPALLSDRVADLMLATGDPAVGDDAEIADAAGVVFSYEDFRQDAGRYVPVDTHPRFALYLRVVTGLDETQLDVEFDRRAVSPATALDALDHLVDLLVCSPEPTQQEHPRPSRPDRAEATHPPGRTHQPARAHPPDPVPRTGPPGHAAERDQPHPSTAGTSPTRSIEEDP